MTLPSSGRHKGCVLAQPLMSNDKGFVRPYNPNLTRVIMRSKYLVRFLSRIAHFEADIELADVVAISNHKGALAAASSAYLFDAVSPKQHPRLAGRTSNAHNRRLAVRHLKATLCASFLKDIYEDLSSYMQCLLEGAARNGLDPNRLIGEHKVQIEANEVLAAKTWPGVVHLVALSVFRRIENEKSTKDLIQKLNAKLNLGVPQSKIDAALPYLELRHLLVHADGVADEKFCKTFPKFDAKVGVKVAMDFSILQVAKKAIVDLAEEFDARVVANNVLAGADLQ